MKEESVDIPGELPIYGVAICESEIIPPSPSFNDQAKKDHERLVKIINRSFDGMSE